MSRLAREIVTRGWVEDACGKQLPLHSHIPLDECRVIQEWILETDPSVLVEVGLAYGVSSLHVCEALTRLDRAADYRIVDPHQQTEWSDVGRLNLERAGHEGRFSLVEEPSELCLPRWMGEGLEIDFALIDGWHSFDQIMVEVFYLGRMLRIGGALVLDDLQLPAVTKVSRWISNLDCFRPMDLPKWLLRSRAARVRRLSGVPEARVAGFLKTAADTRSWDWFRDF